MKVNNIYTNIANYIERTPRAQKILRFADKNPSVFQSTVVFGLATILRPASIMSIPSKTKDGEADKRYSSARSIATGFVDLISALAIFIPLNKAIDFSTRKLFDTPKSVFYGHKDNCSTYKSLFNRGAKIALLPIVAFLNFHYVKKIADGILKLTQRKGKND